MSFFWIDLIDSKNKIGLINYRLNSLVVRSRSRLGYYEKKQQSTTQAYVWKGIKSLSGFYANIILYTRKNNTNNITCLEIQSMFLLLVYNLMPRLQHYGATKGRGILFIPFYIWCLRVKVFPIWARFYCLKKIIKTSSSSITLYCF